MLTMADSVGSPQGANRGQTQRSPATPGTIEANPPSLGSDILGDWRQHQEAQKRVGELVAIAKREKQSMHSTCISPVVYRQHGGGPPTTVHPQCY